MTENYEREIISYLQEENKKLTRADQISVSKCLSAKDHKPTKQDIAICISEVRRANSKMSSQSYGPDISNLPETKRSTVEL